jgi:hypothetical protein
MLHPRSTTSQHPQPCHSVPTKDVKCAPALCMGTCGRSVWHMHVGSWTNGRCGMSAAMLRRSLHGPLSCPSRLIRCSPKSHCSVASSSVRPHKDGTCAALDLNGLNWLLQRPCPQVCACYLVDAACERAVCTPSPHLPHYCHEHVLPCMLQVTRVLGNPAKTAHFDVIRDDLLHPIAGSKMRKFDALWPKMSRKGVTDVVS